MLKYNTGANAPQPQPQLAVSPGAALRIAGIAHPAATLAMLENTARQQIFRGNFPFPVIQIRIGKKRHRTVVRLADIEAALNPPPAPPPAEIAQQKRGRGRPPNRSRAA